MQELLLELTFYHPQTKLREGNVFTPVCDSVHGGTGVSQHAMGRGGMGCVYKCSPRPPGQTPRWADMTPRQTHLPRRALHRAVHILLECIVVSNMFKIGFNHTYVLRDYTDFSLGSLAMK